MSAMTPERIAFLRSVYLPGAGESPSACDDIATVLDALSAERARADELQDAAHWLTNERERLQLELQDATQERDQLRAQRDAAEQRADREHQAWVLMRDAFDDCREELTAVRVQLRAQRDAAVVALDAPCDAGCAANRGGCCDCDWIRIERAYAILQAADQRGLEAG